MAKDEIIMNEEFIEETEQTERKSGKGRKILLGAVVAVAAGIAISKVNKWRKKKAAEKVHAAAHQDDDIADEE